jgi:hypothetical protein
MRWRQPRHQRSPRRLAEVPEGIDDTGVDGSVAGGYGFARFNVLPMSRFRVRVPPLPKHSTLLLPTGIS